MSGYPLFCPSRVLFLLSLAVLVPVRRPAVGDLARRERPERIAGKALR